MTERLATALATVCGRPVDIQSRTPLGGGSISTTEQLRTAAGTFVLKSYPGGAAAMVEAEAAGLEALRASGAPLALPRVIHVETTPPAFLLLEFLDAGPRTADFDEALGHGLAVLHRAAAPRFGFTHDNFCGATPQPNPWTERWVDFYATSRLAHQLSLAFDAGRLNDADRRLIERLIERLGDWIDEPGAPSLIHGDLWRGNLHRDASGRPALLDPAAYYGHREAEFGMITLFGGFSTRVFDAYSEAFPLAPAWRERNALYRLYHLMNHLNLFGSSYHADVMTIVRRFV